MLARGKLYHIFYKTQVKIIKGGLNVAKDDVLPDLWQGKLTHMSEKWLQILVKKFLIPFTKDTSLKPCDNYLYIKQHIISFISFSKREKTVLELVYYDLCSPNYMELSSSSRYFIIFINDTSRKVSMFILKIKDHVL